MTPAFIIASLIYIGSSLSREELERSGGHGFYVDGILAARTAIGR